MAKVKMVGLKNSFFNGLPRDKELLHHMENGKIRPFLIPVKLSYKGQQVLFAIPFRSKLSSKTPEGDFFSLPPRPTTPKNCHHGLHYVKMFPVKSEFFVKYNTTDEYYINLKEVILNNMKEITTEAQKFVDLYENGKQSSYCPNWDNIWDTYFTK